MNKSTNISKLSGWHTILHKSSTSIRLDTKAESSLISSMISCLSSVSNFLEFPFNFSRSFSKSDLVIIFVKILADLFIILAFSEKVSRTSHNIRGASASFTSFLPSSFLHKLSTTINPLDTALASALIALFLMVVRILGTMPLLIRKSLPFFWLLTFFIVSKLSLMTMISSEYKSFTSLIVSAIPASSNLFINWGTWHKLFMHLIKGIEPGPLFLLNSISITASCPLAATNFWANSWSTLWYNEVNLYIISAICLQISSLWEFFKANERSTSIPPDSIINWALRRTSEPGGVIILSKELNE